LTTVATSRHMFSLRRLLPIPQDDGWARVSVRRNFRRCGQSHILRQQHRSNMPIFEVPRNPHSTPPRKSNKFIGIWSTRFCQIFGRIHVYWSRARAKLLRLLSLGTVLGRSCTIGWFVISWAQILLDFCFLTSTSPGGSFRYLVRHNTKLRLPKGHKNGQRNGLRTKEGFGRALCLTNISCPSW